MIRRGRAVAGQELEPAARVLRDELHQAFEQRGHDELARSERGLALDPDAGTLDRLRVDLGQQDALGEVERGHRDRVVAASVLRGRSRTGARREQERERREHERPAGSHGGPSLGQAGHLDVG